MKTVDSRLKACPAEDLLGHALQAVLKTNGDVRYDILFGDFLLFHQDKRLRLIGRRQEPAPRPYDRPTNKQGKQYPPPTAAHDRPKLFKASRYLIICVIKHYKLTTGSGGLSEADTSPQPSECVPFAFAMDYK